MFAKPLFTEILTQLLEVAKKHSSQTETVNQVLEIVDYAVQHSNQRRESAQRYAGSKNK